jgi:iron complex outermembrane recepter protein
VQWRPTEAFQVRLAYNITMDQPSIYALRANGTVGVTATGTNGVNFFDHFTTDSGNPLLRPVLSHNSDLSLEWYPSRATTAHLSLFHKAIDNWITYGSVVRLVPITYSSPTAQTVLERAEVNEVFNSPETAKVKGTEIGGRMFFDRLPAPWDGFGLEANYTYVDSKNPGDRYLDIDGIAHTDAPVQGLSKNNYNITGMYERGPISVRLAYSWRSQYLMSTNSNGTNGDYTFHAAPGDAGQFVDISLPVYSDSYGSLDFGSTWRPNDHMAFSFEMNNLTNEVAKTLMGGYPGGAKYIRSWFISDRRASLSVRYNY